jgi:hypothetical protein
VFLSNILKTGRIVTVVRTDHQDKVAVVNQPLDCVLPILGGITDIFLFGTDDLGESLMQRVYDLRRLVHRQGGLGDVGEELRVLDLEFPDIVHGLDQIHAPDTIRTPVLAQCTFDFRVAGLANKNAFAPLILIMPYFHVHFGD